MILFHNGGYSWGASRFLRVGVEFSGWFFWLNFFLINLFTISYLVNALYIKNNNLITKKEIFYQCIVNKNLLKLNKQLKANN